MILPCLKIKEISTERTPAAGVMRWNSRVEMMKEFTRRRSVYIYSAVAMYRLALGKPIFTPSRSQLILVRALGLRQI